MGALACAPAVRWLIDGEPALREQIHQYLLGVNDHSTIPFALPAPAEEFAKHRRNRDSYKLIFPQVILKLKRVKHHLTGEVGVEVTCSDFDYDAIVRMAREAELCKQISKAPILI